MILEKLTTFVNQRPKLDFADYGDSKYYRQDANEIAKQRKMYYEIFVACSTVMDKAEIESRILKRFEKSVSGGRLTWDKDAQVWDYTTGQYWPTEYRRAAAKLLFEIFWSYLYDTYKENVKSQAKRILGAKVFNYFY